MAETSNKLADLHKQLIIQMLGAWCSNAETTEHIKAEFGICVTTQNVQYYRNQRKAEIEEAREEFKKNLEIIPIANKAKRIEIRQRLVDNLLTHLWLEIPAEKRSGGKTLEWIKEKGNHSLINQILDSVKAEMEPYKMALTDPSGQGSIILLPEREEDNGRLRRTQRALANEVHAGGIEP
jgi:hypothetical protein